MTQPDDSLLHEELIDTNRELVAINRQIAESLANLERMYAEDMRARQQSAQEIQAMTARMNKPVWFILPTLIFPVVLILLLFLRP